LSPEWSGKVMFPLRPVETLASQAAPTRLELRNIQTHASKPFKTGWCHVELLVRRSDEKASSLQALGDGDAYAAGQMIIAAASELKALCLTAGRLPSHGPHRANGSEMFEREGYMRARQPKVPMSPFCFDDEQAAG